ncbi:MAG: phosphatidylglycerophosphatase A [Erysipelotrichaceae bacterium]|nr:phosphatidylglycerophosphatase A [Erysipelotrichaceae bacterium]
MYQKCCDLLNSRGVTLESLEELVFFLQGKYYNNLTQEEVRSAIESVLQKREVQNAILTGVALDLAAEEGRLADKELEQLLIDDAGLYGIDEVLAFGICNLYGSIALTSYGYVDKLKPGIVGVLNTKSEHCNTFMDDIAGAIAACAASKVAHNKQNDEPV